MGEVALVTRGGSFLDSLYTRQGAMTLSMASHTCDTGPIGPQKVKLVVLGTSFMTKKEILDRSLFD